MVYIIAVEWKNTVKENESVFYDYKREYYPIFPVTMYFPKGQALMLPFQIQKAVDTGNVEFYFGHFARKLLREEGGRMTGVIFQSQDGKHIQANAS